MSRIHALRKKFRGLSKVDKTFFITLVVRAGYSLLSTLTNWPLPGFGLVRFVFIIATILFLFFAIPRWIRKLVWRVRYRLLVTWVLVGVVPIVLVCALVGEGIYILMGQVVNYMATTEVARQSDLVGSEAHALAWSVAHRGTSVSLAELAGTFVRDMSAARHAEVGAIIRIGNETLVLPADSSIREIPKWSRTGFAGLVKADEGQYLAAHVVLDDPALTERKTEVFLYQKATDDFFKKLLPDVATLAPNQASVSPGGIDVKVERGNKPRSGFTFQTRNSQDTTPTLDPPAAPLGRWDISVDSIVPIPSTILKTGKDDRLLAVTVSRPSLIVKKLFSSAGNLAFVAVFLVYFTASLLLMVEIISVLFGVKLTRSITRTVADLYQGTEKVKAGDFSHRIRVRSKDQLSELAGSFNSMTERIEGLIVEFKEKQRLENELSIARDVQAQLFPKEFPTLKSLELFGMCQPARTVSGDYYDFVSLGSDRAALAIGDISGKGISAALLMAHIQSALRTQLLHGSTASPAEIISILNNHLYGSSPPEKYATFFLGLYSDDDGEFLYTNAGHLAPIILRHGEILRLPGDGFPVGMFPGAPYEQQSTKLERGDLLVGFTDGVTETPNKDGEEFGDQRLTELLLRLDGKPLDEIANAISDAVTAWAGDVERFDDTTLVFARRS